MRYSGWHLLGTARMGDDPQDSVVDGFGRTHDVENLFVADGSVFVTSGGCNPTSTIVGLCACAPPTISCAPATCRRCRHDGHRTPRGGGVMCASACGCSRTR